MRRLLEILSSIMAMASVPLAFCLLFLPLLLKPALLFLPLLLKASRVGITVRYTGVLLYLHTLVLTSSIYHVTRAPNPFSGLGLKQTPMSRVFFRYQVR